MKFRDIAKIISPALLTIFGCAKTIPYPEGSEWESNGIAELEKIELNGVKHATLIRGTNKDAPVLLHIHGTGIPTMCFAHLEYADSNEEASLKEERFISVHYDQRGFGKTYIHGGRSSKDLTLEQYISDAEEMVKYLRKRFNREKIYLMGESWGSYISMFLIQRHPEWFHAYVGSSQIAHFPEFIETVYDYAETNAKEENNEEALKDLAKFGCPTKEMKPKDVTDAMFIGGKWMDYYQAKEHNIDVDPGFFFASLWNAPEYHMADFKNTMMAYKSTPRKLGAVYMGIVLEKQVPEVEIPVYFIMGEHDLYLETTKRYYDSLKAPQKGFFVIPETAHFARGDKYEEFDDLFYNQIFPETVLSSK